MKWWFSKFFMAILLVLAFILWRNFSDAAIEATIQKILANRDSYEGYEVSVSGTVSGLKLRTLKGGKDYTTKGGKDYTTFYLMGESGGSLTVFVWGQTKLKQGQKVKVTGNYRKVKRVGRSTFYNAIEATEIET